jgi:hypothetical protein
LFFRPSIIAHVDDDIVTAINQLQVGMPFPHRDRR